MPIARFPKDYLEKQDKEFLIHLVYDLYDVYDQIDWQFNDAIKEIITLKYPEDNGQEDTE